MGKKLAMLLTILLLATGLCGCTDEDVQVWHPRQNQ